MSKFKVGDSVETHCNPNCPDCICIEGTISEVLEINGVTHYKVKWDPTWTFIYAELQEWREPNGN